MMGNYEMMPFLVNMARLYELFVARWLAEHIPEGLSLEPQEEVRLDEHSMAFQIDLVIYDHSHRAVCVMDTKYKIDGPSSSDIQQVVAYAESKGCRDAILIYPANPRASRETLVGDIRVIYATFSLDVDLDEAGRIFLKDALSRSS
jgi:5-methylcytosine-specific restriction enzyme subunit McrC